MIQLYINDIEFDLEVGESIALNFAVNNIAELESYQADFTYNFKLPKTQKNITALKYSDQIFDNKTAPYQLNDIFLIQNGVNILPKGVLIIDSVDERYFNCNVFSGLFNFFDLIADLNLVDLDLSSLDEEYNITNINNSKNSTYTDTVIYPVLDYGIYPTNTDIINARFAYPSLFVRTLLDNIITAQGYTVDTNSAILSNSFFNNLVIPFSNDTFENNQRYVTEVTMPDSGNTTANVTDTSTGASTRYKSLIPSFSYTPTENLKVKINVSADIRVNHPAPSGTMDLYICFIGDEGTLDLDLGCSTALAGNTNTTFNTDWVFLRSGEKMEMKIKAVFSAIDTYDIDLLNISFETEVSKDIIYDWTSIRYESILPDISQKDFLKNIFQLMAIVPEIDNVTKTIKYVQFSEIDGNRLSSPNWSNKIDFSKGFSISTKIGDYAQKNNFKYQSDNNVLSELGNGSFNISDTTLEGQKTIVTLKFAATESSSYFDFSLFGATIPKLTSTEAKSGTVDNIIDIGSGELEVLAVGHGLKEGGYVTIAGTTNYNNDYIVKRVLTDSFIIDETFVTEQNGTFNQNTATPIGYQLTENSKPRILYLDVVTGGTGLDLSDDVVTYSAFTSYKVAQFIKPFATNNLGFDDSILTDNYTELQTMLTNANMLVCYFKLSEIDISNLDFFTPIFLNVTSNDLFINGYFYINEVVQYEENKSTKVILTKLQNS